MQRGPTQGRWKDLATWLTTGLAVLLVLFALVGPDRISDLTPWALLRIPIEALLGAALILVLPPNARPLVTALAGVVLGLLTVVKIVDMGFHAVLDRPFDPVLDRSYFGNALDFLTQSIGRAGAIGVAVVAALAAVAVLVALVLAVRRLTRATIAHRRPVIRAVAVLSVVWVACAALGVPVAASNAAALAYDRVVQVRASLHDGEEFAAELAVDAFRDTPPDRFLTALRGKDVVLAFVESYGRTALEDPELAPGVGAVLDAGGAELRAAGFASRSAFLTSSTAGGASWLAHSTLLSGLWVDNQQRFRTLAASDRLTLTSAFRRAGWRTVAVMPATSGSWPEGEIYDYDKIYGTEDLGYRGPSFGFGIMPDQYALSAFQRLEHATPARSPVMAQIALVSSHAPWASIPRLVDWPDVGDGSGMGPVADADPTDVRAQYRRCIEYSLNSLIGYARAYGTDDLVLIFLGDHQPAAIVTGAGASHDVPITIVTRDRAVLDRIASWGWHDGLRPGPQAPVWPMNAFRDRFLAAFGS